MLPLHSINVLTVNLSTGEIKGEEIKDETFLKKYVGGLGVATYLFMKRYSPFVDPYSENSAIVFASGGITGTGVPSSGRMSIVFKSPETGAFFKTNAGGQFGNQLKRAGVDILIVEGKAERPVYININNDNVEIRDASYLWGKDVRETNRLIREELNDPEVEISCIGPAGENKVLYASLQISIYNSAARGGIGALMGDKRLKAIAARGTRYIEVAQPDRFYKVAKRVTEKLFQSAGVKAISDFGTAPESDALNLVNACHFRNFQDSNTNVNREDLKRLTGNYLVSSGLLKRRAGCYSCTIGCHRFVTIDDGPYKGTYTGGPEYETLSTLGAGCGVTDVNAIVKANELCNILGLDTISAGSCIHWLLECKQRGVVTNEMADGLDLSWGNGETVIKLVEKIAYRDGIGNLLAEGTKRASEKLGSNSYRWAVQARGLEQSAVDTRVAFAYALAFAVNPRGPDHLHSECLAEFGSDDKIRYITGSEEYAYPFTTDKRAEIVRWHEDIYAISDCMGMCAFSTTAQYWMDEEDLAELFSSSSGIEITSKEIMKAGRRIITLQKLYNAMVGHTREQDVLPYRFMNEEKTVTIESNSTMTKHVPERKDDIPQIHMDQKGVLQIRSINSKEVLDKMKDDYYRLHGWDLSTGWPTLKTLKELGLDEFALDALKHIKLPEGGF